MKKREIISIIALLIIACVIGGVAGYYLRNNKVSKEQLEKEKAMKQEYNTIVHVEDDVEEETEEAAEEEQEQATSEGTSSNQTETKVEARKATDAEKYTYLCIGNSISCNEYPLSVDGLWWSASGMAVSEPGKDYSHLFKKYLDKLTPEIKGDVKLQTIVTKNWENSSDRTTNSDVILSALTDDIKVVSIQMGENVTDGKDTMFADFDYLFTGIRDRLPDAQIYIFQQLLWPDTDPNVSQAMYEACVKNNFIIVDVAEFYKGYNSKEYRAKVGDEVLGDDGLVYTVTDNVVAAHPNDAGHECIFNCLKNTYEENN